jgi:hypothetical protein
VLDDDDSMSNSNNRNKSTNSETKKSSFNPITYIRKRFSGDPKYAKTSHHTHTSTDVDSNDTDLGSNDIRDNIVCQRMFDRIFWHVRLLYLF